MSGADYVVVGAGSAGCAVAERLSRTARVLLLEAGGRGRSPWVRVPIGYGRAFVHPALNWRLWAEPDPGMGGRRIYWPRGKGLGGSSAINAMVWIRGQAEDFDGWAALGNPGWSFADLLPVFREIEDDPAGAPEWHGVGGPVSVTDIEGEAHPLCADFLAACEAAGLARNPDFNGASQEGAGLYRFSIRRGLRCSAADAFLRPARGRETLEVRTGAHATRILFEGRRAVGVEYRLGGETLRAMAAREVILCAGAVGSPRLLMLSGVGDPAHLREMGIETVAPLRMVGRNLQDHVGYQHDYEATRPTLNQTLGTWRGRIAAALRFALRRAGPFAQSVNHAGGFFRTSPERTRPNMQLYFAPLTWTRAPPGKGPMARLDPFAGFIISISNCHPASRGRVSLRAPDPFAPPRIEPAYLSADEDVEEMLEGARFLHRLAAAPPLRAIIAREITPGLANPTDAEIIDDIRARAGTVFHPCGTCAMGPDPEAWATDARLRVHGTERLRVIDASIFPRIIAGNLNAAAIMTGVKGAAMVLEDAAGR